MSSRARTITIALATLASLSLAMGAAAAPPHGDGGHIHHVHTGNGCVEVDAVAFLAEDRGLHRGANSSGFERGIWHGPCH